MEPPSALHISVEQFCPLMISSLLLCSVRPAPTSPFDYLLAIFQPLVVAIFAACLYSIPLPPLNVIAQGAIFSPGTNF